MSRERGWNLRWPFVMALAVGGLMRTTTANVAVVQTPPDQVPEFTLDAEWPKPLPNNWMFGQIWGVAIDSKDHAWVIHNPKGGWPFGDNTVADIKAAGKVPAPPVVEFDADGNVVQGWGGNGTGYSWMQVSNAAYPYGTPAEHAIFVDYKDNVWVTGNGHVALKFTPAGKFLLQIGELWKTNGSNDRRLLGNPTDLAVDAKANEVYIADGYVNHRVVVFDADTGAYKRHWGAYGLKPTDGPVVKTDSNPDDNLVPDSSDSLLPGKWPVPQWWYPVHGVRISKDGLVYVCDRQHSRVQVFQTSGKFVHEVILPATGIGSASGVAFSVDPKQQFLFVAGGKTWILRRSDLKMLGSVDTTGNHYISLDSKGNLYTNGGRTNGVRSPNRYLAKTKVAKSGLN
jgi:NHL repeat-containing protein